MELLVKYDQKPCYKIVIEDDYSHLTEELSAVKKYKRACIITDSNVAPLHLDELKANLIGQFEVLIDFIIPAGEENKNLDWISLAYKRLIEAHFDRNDLIIAFGGGVIGDMSGFAAATYLRGIDFIQVPTTLLAMVDSSVGGKTGVDCMNYKNMVGAFYMPRLVYMNLSLLTTLPYEQFCCGMGEVIKYGCIYDSEFLNYLIDSECGIKSMSYSDLSYMICHCCDIKRAVVEEDPGEKGLRAILNFGHTIGHAIEKLSDFKLYHGQCVALGMVSALYISKKLNYVSINDEMLVKKALLLYDLPINYDQNLKLLTVDEIYSATLSDKKMSGNSIKFVILDALGHAEITTELSPDLIMEAISILL